MITRPILLAQSTDSRADEASVAGGAGGMLLQTVAVQDFSRNVTGALLAALVERGDDLSDLALQRRLQCHAAIGTTASTEQRRYA